jgi:hypothetical protein
VVLNENIFGFEVTVSDTMLMEVLCAAQETAKNIARSCFVKSLLRELCQPFEKIAAANILHDQVELVWSIEEPHKAYNMWVIYERQHGNLCAEMLPVLACKWQSKSKSYATMLL